MRIRQPDQRQSQKQIAPTMKDPIITNANLKASKAVGTNKQIAMIKALSSILVTRSRLAGALGKTYGGDRDLYEVCGYPTQLMITDYRDRFQRQEIAYRIVHAYPDACWREEPEIYEDEDPSVETEFEKAWKEISIKLRMHHYMHRLDVLAGVGRYGAMFLGYEGGESFTEPIKKGTKRVLAYLTTLDEGDAVVSTWERNSKDPRFGMPLSYNMTFSMGDTERPALSVHWSRVIHVADGCTNSDVYGTPRLESVWNRLEDIDKIASGSAEAQWRFGFPGMAFKADADADISAQDESALEDEVEEYMHGLSRYLQLKGIEPQMLSPNVRDSTQELDNQIKLISAGTGIPQRILTGSERGELASTTDQENWGSRVRERQEHYCTPCVVRAVVDRLIESGVLPEPKEEYDVAWPEPETSPAEDANIAKVKTDTISAYVGGGVEDVIPLGIFLETVVGMDKELADQIVDEREARMEQESADQEAAMEEQQRMAAEQAAAAGAGQRSSAEGTPFEDKRTPGASSVPPQKQPKGNPFVKQNFDPDQPRADDGKWTDGSGGDGEGLAGTYTIKETGRAPMEKTDKGYVVRSPDKKTTVHIREQGDGSFAVTHFEKEKEFTTKEPDLKSARKEADRILADIRQHGPGAERGQASSEDREAWERARQKLAAKKDGGVK